MKRKISHDNEEESRLSQLLFNKSKDLAEKLKIPETDELDIDRKPAWIDDDDEAIRTTTPHTSNKVLYSDKLKQKYENLIGTPKWAKLEQIKSEEQNDDLLKTVGHLRKTKPNHLPKDYLELKRLPQINSTTGSEGPIITCVEFHPKMSVAMVAGKSGVVSLFSIGGDNNNKLHSFKLNKFNVSSGYFTPDGTEAYISSKQNHSYCIYNLEKAEPKLVQLPRVVGRPSIFKVSSNGKFIATSTGYDEIYLISVESRELLRSLKNNEKVISLCFSPDCQQLYCYHTQGEVTVWDLSTYRVVKKFYDHGCVTANCITTSPCGKLLATGSGEGIVNIYETSTLTVLEPLPLKTISHLKTKITHLNFNSTSEILAASSGFFPNAVKLVHIPSYHVFMNFPIDKLNMHQIETVNFSPNSGYMALGNNRGNAYLYRLNYYKNY